MDVKTWQHINCNRKQYAIALFIALSVYFHFIYIGYQQFRMINLRSLGAAFCVPVLRKQVCNVQKVQPFLTKLFFQVCEEQGCQEEVFPLAISYLDRFLSICTVGKSQVQLLGTTCLLLASKLREPGSRGLSAEVLIFYTANSITLADLCVSNSIL